MRYDNVVQACVPRQLECCTSDRTASATFFKLIDTLIEMMMMMNIIHPSIHLYVCIYKETLITCKCMGVGMSLSSLMDRQKKKVNKAGAQQYQV